MDTIGKMIDANSKRDAIHVAIAPVMATERLAPGQHVGLVHGTTDRVKAAGPHIGIVDPFLAGPVFALEWFYLFLYPNTVTSLRHEWTHPAFAEDKQTAPPASRLVDAKKDAEAWLRAYAHRVSPYKSPEKAYQRLLVDLRTGELFYDGTDLHSFSEVEEPDELRKNAEILGIQIDWTRFSFSCSC